MYFVRMYRCIIIHHHASSYIIHHHTRDNPLRTPYPDPATHPSRSHPTSKTHTSTTTPTPPALPTQSCHSPPPPPTQPPPTLSYPTYPTPPTSLIIKRISLHDQCIIMIPPPIQHPDNPPCLGRLWVVKCRYPGEPMATRRDLLVHVDVAPF